MRLVAAVRPSCGNIKFWHSARKPDESVEIGSLKLVELSERPITADESRDVHSAR